MSLAVTEANKREDSTEEASSSLQQAEQTHPPIDPQTVQGIIEQLDSELCQIAEGVMMTTDNESSSTDTGPDALPDDLEGIQLQLPQNVDFNVDDLFTVNIIGEIEEDVGFIGTLTGESPLPEVPPNSPSFIITDETLCEFLLASSLSEDPAIEEELEEKLQQIRQAREETN